MNLEVLNGDEAAAREALAGCCGSRAWVEAMLARRPFADADAAHAQAEEAWFGLGVDDWREAFSHHPRIGDVDRLRERFGAARAAHSETEQAGVEGASDETLAELARLNDVYYDRHGFVFLVCATGKTADEMLEILRGRLDHTTAAELRVAAVEQSKITRIRMEKL